MQSKSRKILIPYAIVILFAYIGFALPLPILPEMFLDPVRSIIPGASLHTKMILLGLVMASFPLGQFFGSPLLGRLSDHYGRKKIILMSLAGTTLGYLVTAYAVHSYSISGMFAGLAICGFCEGNVTIAQSVVADLTEKEEQQTEKAVHFGWINIFISLGFIIGPLMGGQLADPTVVSWFTFSTPFWAAACMTVIGMVVIYLYSKETLKVKPEGKWEFFSSMWSGMRRPRLKGFYVANFFLALGYFSFFRFFPVFLERQFDFSASMLSYVMVYDSLAIGAGVIWLIPYLSKRLKPIQSLCLFAFLLAVAFIVCLLPKSPYALLVTLPPLGFCLAVVITNGSLLISNTASHQFQGQAMGTLTSVQVLAEIFTGLAGGPLAAYTMTMPLYIGAAMAVVCGLILMNAIRRERYV
ncbi:MAG: MFS transporter [Verrucomicrobia bacterium]|nr:MFS transporter [Verrucomicrobiota bacterium]